MTDDPRFEALLDYLTRTRNFDFSGYKRSSLVRRVQRRIEKVGLKDYVDYMDFLEVHPDEFIELFNTILINVTGFFRDQVAWDYVAGEIVPQILAVKSKRAPIRLWSAGCATGEEAYSLAIMLCQILGLEQFHERVKIYATDADEEALAHARAAVYTEKEMDGIMPELQEKYFTANGDGRFAFRQDLRRSVIFGRHNLVQDAPISKLDLLTCRNTLMYFNAETQSTVLNRFHFALNDQGYLFLGKAEMLLTHANLFTPTEMKYRVFAKADRSSLRDRLLLLSKGADDEPMTDTSGKLLLKDAAFDIGAVPQLVIDSAGILAIANDSARESFGLNQRDVGRPFQDLEISYRPVELRSMIDQCYTSRQTVKQSGIARHTSAGQVQYHDVHVAPLIHDSGTIIGASVTFVDVTSAHKLHLELQRSNKDLELANEELQSAHEELETTNEELQSTNEELEATNEELQSTNEELETMNEELQSTNEELETINAEQRELTNELNSANSFLNATLACMSSAVIVLDLSYKILVWNPRAEDMWGLRQDEVTGQPLFNLDIGLPVLELKDPLMALDDRDRKQLSFDARNRRGKTVKCEVTLSKLLDPKKHFEGYILLMDER